MTPPYVLAAHDIRGVLAERVYEAARRAHLGIAIWKGEPLPEEPTLLIAELPAGQRRISEEVATLVEEHFPDARLLLLCHEPLTKPTVILQEGRVTLVGAPLETEDIAATMRSLVRSGRRRAPTLNLSGAMDDDGGPVLVREQLRADHWVARIASAEQNRPRLPLPLVSDHSLDGLLVLFTTNGRDHDEADVARAVSALRLTGDHELREQALAEALGSETGLVHLSPTKDTWTFYWPLGEAPLWLYSPLRLPTWWDVSAAMSSRGTSISVLPAYACDLVVAMSSWGPLDRTAKTAHESLSEALEGGSPSMVELLQRRLLVRPMAFSAAIVEVR